MALSMVVHSRKYVCPICREYARPFYGGILRHIGEVHSHDPHFGVVCGLGAEPKCPASYTNYQSFRRHVYKKHRDELELDPQMTGEQSSECESTPDFDLSDSVSIILFFLPLLLYTCDSYYCTDTVQHRNG